MAAEMDDLFIFSFTADQLERRFQDGEDLLAWDLQARYASDEHKFSLLNEGEYALDENRTESSEWQFRYGRMVSEFFDAHVGLRHDAQPKPDRTYLVLGIEGLAPQWFEVDVNLFLSDKGKGSARLAAEYDLLLTQRLVLQAEGELNMAFSDDVAVGRGSGINNLELGLRLRYEITRNLAPYIGVSWERSYGETGDLAVTAGEDREQTAVVAGVAFWF
jgi:copper resistance protein B